MYVEKQFFDDELMQSIIAIENELKIRDLEELNPTTSLERNIKEGIRDDRNIYAIETEVKNRKQDWEKEWENWAKDNQEESEE